MNGLRVQLLAIVAIILSASVCKAPAGDLNEGLKIQERMLQDAAASQAHIDQIHEQTQGLLDEYGRVTRELESLKRYDDHLERMIQQQADAITQLEQQLEEVAISQREILPLMSRMVQALSRFIELDLPFLLQERRRRVAGLTAMIDAPDVSVAEKYRRILDAYRIEVDYGRSVEAYRGTLIASTRERIVEFLRVGRLILIYQTLDGSETAIWDRQAASWIPLPEDYRLALGKAFRVARKQAAPDLLQLPVFVPESM